MWTHTNALVNALRATWKKLTANPDGGYASEAVLVTALLILCALVVIGVITAKVTSKANDIDLGQPPPGVSMTTGTWEP
ncbi:hypothetical protein [Actinophytocola sp. NPDC049390]|uniref:hypothetical protein n=1 Tax=Actinophytocola sp. NPDC049390 TaxID=3363894 RepID=UPI0037B79779